MVLHARDEGVPCSSYSTSHVGHDQSRLMENLPNRLSHHRHLLCCPSSLPFFSWIFLSVQIGSCANQLIQCKVHEIFFPKSLHLLKTHSNWGSYAPFPRHCNLPRVDFSTCISDVWEIAPPVVLQLYRSWMCWTEDLMEILNIQLSCIVNLDLCTKLMRLSVVRSWNLKMLMMVFKILGTVSLLIIWVSCPAWLVKFRASPDMCSFRVMSLTKRKARSRFAIICKHMQHNHILN